MLNNLETSIQNAHTILSQYPNYILTVGEIDDIVKKSDQQPHLSSIDAYALGFIQALKTIKGGEHND